MLIVLLVHMHNVVYGCILLLYKETDYAIIQNKNEASLKIYV